MPSPFAFTPDYDGSVSLESAVYQALGAASVCWEDMEAAGVFDSARAKEIGEVLIEYLLHYRSVMDEDSSRVEAVFNVLAPAWEIGGEPMPLFEWGHETTPTNEEVRELAERIVTVLDATT